MAPTTRSAARKAFTTSTLTPPALKIPEVLEMILLQINIRTLLTSYLLRWDIQSTLGGLRVISRTSCSFLKTHISLLKDNSFTKTPATKENYKREHARKSRIIEGDRILRIYSLVMLFFSGQFIYSFKHHIWTLTTSLEDLRVAGIGIS